MLILCLPFVYAQDSEINVYRPNEVFDLSVHLLNSTGGVEGATCQIAILNESKNLIIEDTLNEISGGWYNYSYNISDVGYYNCRQNCTKGDKYIAGTCDFAIKGDDSVPLAAIISILVVIFVYLWIISNFTTERLKDHGLIKTLLFGLILWILLLPVNFSIETLGQNGATASMISIMSTMHIVMIYLNVAFSFYLVVFLIVSFARSIQENVQTSK